MLTGDLELVRRHGDLIQSVEVCEAYRYLVGHAALLPNYRCEARQKGVVADFRYYEAEEQPFAFIVNQQSLLWFFRTPGLRHAAADLPRLREQFADVRENAAGEITVRVSTLADAVRLVRMIFDSTPLSNAGDG